MGRPSKIDREAAFEMYFGEVGQRGSFKEIADHYGVAASTVAKLSSQYQWPRRALEREQEIRNAVDRKMVKTHAQRVIENLKLLDALKAIFAKQLMPGQNGRPNPNQLREVSVRELIDIIKIEQLLTGNPTDVPGETAQARSLAEIESELAELPDEELEAELRVMLGAHRNGDSGP